MIGITNRDSSFFTIRTKPRQPEGVGKSELMKDLADRVVSLEITEEWGKMINGSITFEDDNNWNIAYLLKFGTPILLQWGYKAWSTSLGSIKSDPRVISISGAPKRAAQAIVTNPSGSGSTSGEIRYNCSFVQNFTPPLTARFKKYPPRITKGALVAMVLTGMGIPSPMQFVAFSRMNESYDTGYQVVQDYETDYKFLVRLSMEWRCVFRIAYTPKGDIVALFASPDMVNLFPTAITGGIGLFNELRYKTAQFPNVKNYSWNHNVGDSGSGDSVRIVYVNGQPQYWRMKAKTDTVVFYKLNTEKMKTEMAKLNHAGKVALYKEWMSKENMDELIRDKYYIPVEEKTAPQGIGLSLSAEMIGDPLWTAPNRAKFSGAFPDYFLMDKLHFFVRRVTHKIDRSGYNMSVEVVDAFTISGGNLVG